MVTRYDEEYVTKRSFMGVTHYTYSYPTPPVCSCELHSTNDLMPPLKSESPQYREGGALIAGFSQVEICVMYGLILLPPTFSSSLDQPYGEQSDKYPSTPWNGNPLHDDTTSHPDRPLDHANQRFPEELFTAYGQTPTKPKMSSLVMPDL